MSTSTCFARPLSPGDSEPHQRRHVQDEFQAQMTLLRMIAMQIPVAASLTTAPMQLGLGHACMLCAVSAPGPVLARWP